MCSGIEWRRRHNIMEWVRLESIHQNVEYDNGKKNVEFKDNSIQKNKKSNPNAKIKALRIKNFNLQQKLKHLKSQRMT